MKLFDLMTLASAEGGEYVLGAKDLHIQTCYLIYGYLEGGEGRRLIKPGESHDEILCAVDGPILMHTTRGPITLAVGHAVHVKEDESFLVSNPLDRPVVYVVAGGRRWPNNCSGSQ
ncbi:MAG: hypothetical protein ACLP5H_27640 [Desulfomonilaceae bacterium]